MENIKWKETVYKMLCVGESQFCFIAMHTEKKKIEQFNWRFIRRKSVLSAQLLSCVWLFATPRTVAHQAQTLSMGFSRQEYWSELPFPSPTKNSLISIL